MSCRRGQVQAGCRGETGAGCALRQAKQPRAEIAEGVGKQAGDMHLGDTELLADFRLRHVTVKAHPQDLLLTKRQLAPVRGDSPHTEHVLHLRIVLAEEVTQAGCVGLTAQRLIQRP